MSNQPESQNELVHLQRILALQQISPQHYFSMHLMPAPHLSVGPQPHLLIHQTMQRVYLYDPHTEFEKPLIQWHSK